MDNARVRITGFPVHIILRTVPECSIKQHMASETFKCLQLGGEVELAANANITCLVLTAVTARHPQRGRWSHGQIPLYRCMFIGMLYNISCSGGHGRPTSLSCECYEWLEAVFKWKQRLLAGERHTHIEESQERGRRKFC